MRAPTEFLSETIEIDDETVRSFQEKGHTVVEGLCPTDAVAAWREVLVGAALRHSGETRPLEERDAYGKAFLQITNLWQREEAVRPLVLARRFAGVAARLLGVERVRLYHGPGTDQGAGRGSDPPGTRTSSTGPWRRTRRSRCGCRWWTPRRRWER